MTTATRGGPRIPSFRVILTAAIGVLVILALASSLFLVLLTTKISEVSKDLGAAIESMRVIDELQVELHTHSREINRLPRTDSARGAYQTAEERLQALQREMLLYVGSPDEVTLAERVNHAIDRYLEAQASAERSARSPESRELARGELDEAFAELDRLVQLNIAQARAAKGRAEDWDWLANAFGGAVALLLSVGAVGLITWLWSFALLPLFDLARSIERFSSGDRSARAQRLGLRELRETADRFNAMASALERERRNQLAFLASVAHDLRNPVAALSTSLAIIEEAGPSPDRTRRARELCGKQVEMLERMIGDLIDEACIEAGQLDLKLSVSDPKLLAREVVDLYASSTARPISLRTCADDVLLECDPVRIMQVLQNLLGNALKYSPASSSVDVSVEKGERGASFVVSDCGVGIPPEELPRLFEPFHRAANGKKIAPGVGLGLSVAKRVVESHGGRIEVRSIPGNGSTFRVYLPSRPPHSVLPQPLMPGARLSPNHSAEPGTPDTMSSALIRSS